MAIDHDHLFKELLQEFYTDLIELFFPEVAAYLDPAHIDYLNQEIFHDIAAGERMEADLIAKVRFIHQDAFFLIHIEPQATHQEEFPWRMFRYFAKLHELHRLPVYPIALYSFDSPKRSVPSGYSISFFDYYGAGFSLPRHPAQLT